MRAHSMPSPHDPLLRAFGPQPAQRLDRGSGIGFRKFPERSLNGFSWQVLVFGRGCQCEKFLRIQHRQLLENHACRLVDFDIIPRRQRPCIRAVHIVFQPCGHRLFFLPAIRFLEE